MMCFGKRRALADTLSSSRISGPGPQLQVDQGKPGNDTKANGKENLEAVCLNKLFYLKRDPDALLYRDVRS